MALRAGAIVLATLCAAAVAYAGNIKVEVFNNTVVDLLIHLKDARVVLIAPGADGAAEIGEEVWIDFGAIAHRYKLPRELRGQVRLQAEPNGGLYLIPPGDVMPVSTPPPQPKPFPLLPVEKVDLTSATVPSNPSLQLTAGLLPASAELMIR